MRGQLTRATPISFKRRSGISGLVGRDRIREVETPVGQTPAFVPPFNIEGMEPGMGPVPELGQHTDEVLRQLGVSEADIGRWREERVVG